MLRIKKEIIFEGTKKSAKKTINSHGIPKELVIPLKQHIGKEAKPIVEIGDKVKKYQKIASADGNFSANIHASSSGEVSSIERRITCDGDLMSIVIKTDGKDEKIKPEISDSMIENIKSAGIVGMGGACFPTHIKLSPDKTCDTYILNGCECEPYLTSDLRIMIEEPDKVINGFKILMKTAGIKRGIIGVEEKDAYDSLSKYIEPSDNITIRLLKPKYPQGAEKILIYNLLGRKTPTGKIPSEVGVIVNNVSTAKAVNDAAEGLPVVERVVTVSGNSGVPKNILVKIGTKFNDILEYCSDKVIAGGPMMGRTTHTLEVPVTKGINGITLLGEEEDEYENCIRCGSCIETCPMNLMPAKLANYSSQGLYDMAKEYYLYDCFECGSCAYVCPCRIPIVQLIKTAKKEFQYANK